VADEAHRGRVRVLIADDSLVSREMLSQILRSDPAIEVVGEAVDGEEAVAKAAELRPDLITMDIHMPRMDGLAATERIMAFNPTPILVVSSSVYGEGMGRAFDALKLGALEVIKKPEPRDWADLDRIGRDVIHRVKVLSRIRVITHIKGKRDGRTASMLAGGTAEKTMAQRQIVAIGSSTGGPSALLSVLGRLGPDLPVPVVVAQHIADGFIPGLVSWLDAGCMIKVAAAADGEPLLPGKAYFAPTGRNLVADGLTARFKAPSVGQLYIPSADTLFESVARSFGSAAVGVLLTGMGADGAIGLKAMRDRGAATLAQDEATSTVYGMPRAAAEMGAVDTVLPVHEIGARIVELVSTA